MTLKKEGRQMMIIYDPFLSEVAGFRIIVGRIIMTRYIFVSPCSQKHIYDEGDFVRLVHDVWNWMTPSFFVSQKGIKVSRLVL